MKHTDETQNSLHDHYNTLHCFCREREKMETKELLDGMKALYRAYVRTMEAGRDRIVDLGGECDSVERMEDSDPALIAARELIAKATGATS